MSHPTLPERILFIGDLHASGTPLVLRTLLGSCIAVCLFDPVAHVGGMNHFALPDTPDPSARTRAARFGLPAMTQLLGALVSVGGARDRLLATIVGGGHLLVPADVANSIPQRNIAFARLFLAKERIAVVGEDIGGQCPRQVRFHTATGGVFVTRLRSTACHRRLTDSCTMGVPAGGQPYVVCEEQ
jgi:chemotaxis protein CheD